MQQQEQRVRFTLERTQSKMEGIEQHEPLLCALLELAALHPGYDRARAYEAVKTLAKPLIGWKARNPALQGEQTYTAFVQAVDALLAENELEEEA